MHEGVEGVWFRVIAVIEGKSAQLGGLWKELLAKIAR